MAPPAALSSLVRTAPGVELILREVWSAPPARTIPVSRRERRGTGGGDSAPPSAGLHGTNAGRRPRPLPRGTQHRSPQRRRGPLPRTGGALGCRAAVAQLWVAFCPT